MKLKSKQINTKRVKVFLKQLICFCILLITTQSIAKKEIRKEKVIEKSKHFPKWAKKGFKKGITFQIEKSKSKSSLCKGAEALFFVEEYEKQINVLRPDSTPYFIPRQIAERLAMTQLASSLAQMISTDITTEIESGFGESDGEASELYLLTNKIKSDAEISGITKMGQAWQRIEKNGNTYWRIYVLASICKEEYDSIIRKKANAMGIPSKTSTELSKKITETKKKKVQQMKE